MKNSTLKTLGIKKGGSGHNCINIRISVNSVTELSHIIMNIGKSGYWVYENKELNIRTLTAGTILAIENGKYVVTLPHIGPGITHEIEPERMYIITRKQ